MSMTRREFTAATASTVTLTVLGCDDGRAAEQARQLEEATAAAQRLAAKEKQDPKKANLATEPFLIGRADRYFKPGVYDEYKKEKGVWIVSDGKELVVFSATCTHLACTTELDLSKQLFKCPCHKSGFDFQGMNTKGSKAKRPLERCALRLVDSGPGVGQVEVDPTRRFRKDKDQWSDPAAALKLG